MTEAVVITGIGLFSGLGEGIAAHVEAARGSRAAVIDREGFAPYPVHPLGTVELDRQIPKKSDQRQMEPWQRIGVYAAGLALDSAGIKGDAEAKDRLHVIVAAGGGERDHAVDGQILTGLKTAANPGVFLNERLLGDLRPTLFLAQLSNLLAGNISIVHGVTGPSRTFMGEEQAGVDAVRVAHARIAAGQAEMILVGGSYNAERRDMLLLFELGGVLLKGAPVPTFSRTPGNEGMVTGSVGAFLVLESATSAAARGARVLARLDAVSADKVRREDGAITRSLVKQLSGHHVEPSGLVVSAASGLAGAAAEEKAALAVVAPGRTPVAVGDLVGHAIEAAFPAAVALAAALLSEGEAASALVTGVGHHRGEGVASLSVA
ncbi:MAG: beta-ketoacyl-ACP synthase [Bosea sp. (in: a-proteobacteria)]